MINIKSLSDDERKKLGFEMIADIKSLEDEQAHIDDSINEIEFEKAHIAELNKEIEGDDGIAELNKEIEEERMLKADSMYLGGGKWINSNCFRGEDS